MNSLANNYPLSSVACPFSPLSTLDFFHIFRLRPSLSHLPPLPVQFAILHPLTFSTSTLLFVNWLLIGKLYKEF